MVKEKNKGGRPETSEEDKKIMLQKLEPYLKSGLSVRKALLEAKVPNTTFYAIMDRDPKFREQINSFRQFLSIMLNNALVRQLQDIVKKRQEGKKLAKVDIGFMKWFALNSNITKGEYGERKEVGLYDPEAEIQRIAGLIDEVTGKKESKE